jgi:hypothetical protein
MFSTVAFNLYQLSQIDRDIDRTFPKHVLFENEESIGQSALRRILQYYAAIDAEVSLLSAACSKPRPQLLFLHPLQVGYCQGMGFIAALFLTYLVEEEAFYCFYAVLTV